MTKRNDFDKILVSAIDEALNSLGESVKKSIYFHIEHNFKVPRDRIPENLVEFQGGLEEIFGEGAQYIEILIMKNLHSKIGQPLRLKNKQLAFEEYVIAAKEGFLKKNSCARNTRKKKRQFGTLTRIHIGRS